MSRVDDNRIVATTITKLNFAATTTTRFTLIPTLPTITLPPVSRDSNWVEKKLCAQITLPPITLPPITLPPITLPPVSFELITILIQQHQTIRSRCQRFCQANEETTTRRRQRRQSSLFINKHTNDKKLSEQLKVGSWQDHDPQKLMTSSLHSSHLKLKNRHSLHQSQSRCLHYPTCRRQSRRHVHHKSTPRIVEIRQFDSRHHHHHVHH